MAFWKSQLTLVHFYLRVVSVRALDNFLPWRPRSSQATHITSLISALLQLVQRQQWELQRCGALSSDVAVAFHAVCDLVGQGGVTWADGEGDHAAFHINSIIDIPLVTSAGVVVNRVRSPGHPTTGTSVHSGACQGWTHPVSSCPGPVQNGQGMFSSHSASLPASSPHLGPLPSLTDPGHHGTSSLPPTTPSLAPPSSQGGSDIRGVLSPGPPLTLGAVVTHPTSHHQLPSDIAPPSTVHAGHTPNPKILVHRRHNGQGEEVVTGPCEVNSAHVGTGPDCTLPPPPPAPTLNSTFSVLHGAIDRDSQAEGGNSTVLLEGTSHLCVPVVDSERSTCTEKGANPTESVGAVLSDGSHASSDSRNGQGCHISSLTGPVSVSSGGLSTDNPQNMSTSTGEVREQGESARCREVPQNKENDGLYPKSSSGVRRAINFDAAGLGSTPMRSEGKSYADAVRTPTPPRQPLRALDCNSPQLQAQNLAAGEPQTPKNCRQGSGYVAGPQAMDNMRRLKQLGMPSLVENLVTGHHAGVSETSRPGYMQPTKATARRVRRQPLSKDDSFNPRRIPQKSLAHRRSQSTSQLNRIGWKI